LKITSAASGAGDGEFQVLSNNNADQNIRQGSVVLNNGKEQRIYQDASGSMLALSPRSAVVCDPLQTQAQFAVSWVSSSASVEVRLNTPSGALVGSYGSSGSVDLPKLSDGTLVFLVESSSSPRVLASTRAVVRTGDCTAPAIFPRGLVNAASYSPVSIAPGSLASLFGERLSPSIAQATSSPLPERLGGIEVLLGGLRCQLSFVSPGQINFAIPANLPPGRYLLSVGSSSTEVNLTAVSPGIFTIKGNGSGVPFAAITVVFDDGSTQNLPAYNCAVGGCAAVPVGIPEATKEMYIVLYGTGFRNLRNVSASVGPIAAEVVYVGPHSQFTGVDQINLRLGNVEGLTRRQSLILRADGTESNATELLFQ
jgi:uncharacterized protein (TIGR03437 family)